MYKSENSIFIDTQHDVALAFENGVEFIFYFSPFNGRVYISSNSTTDIYGNKTKEQKVLEILEKHGLTYCFEECRMYYVDKKRFSKFILESGLNPKYFYKKEEDVNG